MVIHNFVTNHVIHDKPLSITKSFRFIKNLRYARVAGIISIFVFFLLALDFAFPLVISDNTVEGVGAVSNTSLTLTTNHEQAKLNIVPTSTSGSFAASTDAEKAKFSVSTNNSTGYTLAIKGSSNNKLSNAAASTTLDSITTASTGIDAATFNTNTSYLNKWGYMPSKYNGQNNTTKYYGITSSDVTLNETSAPNASGTSDSYSIGLGAKVDYNKPAGSYTNTFILAAVGKPVPYTINYRDGTGDSSVTGLPYTDSTHTTSSTSVTANYGTTSTITRTGYTFANKWCLGTVNTTGVNPGTTCTGTVYNNGSSIDFIDQTSSSSVVTLYAMWTPATYSLSISFAAGGGIDSVQVRTAPGTGGELKGTVSTSGGSVSGLTYNTAYYLYPNFKEFYELDSWTKTSSTGTLSSRTDLNPTFTIGAGDGRVMIRANDTRPYMQNFSDTDAAAMSEGTEIALRDARDEQVYTVAKINGQVWMTRNLAIGCNGSYSEYGDRMDSQELNSTDSNVSAYWDTPTDSLTAGDSYTDARMECSSTYGAWYNYKAATAGTISGESNTTDATEDICPKGWRLPTYYEFTGLASDSGFKTLFNPVKGGHYAEGHRNDDGLGEWWSASSDNNTARYFLRYAGVLTVNAYTRDRGYYVRCVKDFVPTMQNFSDTDETAMNEGGIKVLRDSREGDEKYTVAKINGHVWMTQNLRFQGTHITPEDTNINTAKNISYGDLTIGNSLDNPRIHVSENSDYGVWYNYAAASAMTITGSNNTNDATYDICPKGWRLPTHSEQISLKNFSGNFSPVVGGYYLSGSLQSESKGYWWSSTHYDGTMRWDMSWNGSSLEAVTNAYAGRTAGFYIRCIFSD